ncbi:MAG TPA: 1-deoxy-D-xylulose-5-phosphate synthase [Bacillota bacterium]|nr:1-deoxy-D-xylulose-5-phosphate synthase [Bacillota bacterium]
MGKLLAQIQKPQDLHKLKSHQLEELACEIRTEIIGTVSKTGGHLASSLGTVELTIALHLTFNSPKDKLIWDVGHQAYAHKLLTGRQKQFHTLRQYGGLAGFPRMQESPHDIVDAGHSSTSISIALGLARGRDLAGTDENIVAIIGDGSMGGGMAFEALNHAGQLKTDLLVVLNDNEMSISPNVGALSQYLTRLRTDPTLTRAREDVDLLLKKLPGGPAVVRLAERLKGSIKYLVVPGMLFEEMGFTYLGPVDGHNIPALCRALADARHRKGPVLLHVVTKKGKGYLPAEQKPDCFHGVGPFHIQTGKPKHICLTPTYTEAFSQTLLSLAEEDDKICAITAAMPDGTGLQKFRERFPERFYDVGIAEQHAVTFAAGLALAGQKPVVAIYSSFLQRAFDQIIHDICLPNLPVVFAVDRAGLVGEDGHTHHGAFDLSYLRQIPNLTVLSPSNLQELQSMLKSAFLWNTGPVAIRYPRGTGEGETYTRLEEIPTLNKGVARQIRKGNNGAIFAIGAAVSLASEAAEQLARAGHDPMVVDARFVKPLDPRLVTWAREAGFVLTVEENVTSGGFGSAVMELLAEKDLQVPVHCLGLPDKFVTHGSVQLLREECGLTVENIKGIFIELERKNEISGR